jgi:hypothetical protein
LLRTIGRERGGAKGMLGVVVHDNPRNSAVVNICYVDSIIVTRMPGSTGSTPQNLLYLETKELITGRQAMFRRCQK